MYSLNLPVSAIRTKIRQEFEKHRYVSQLNVVDVLLFQSHAEFQVSPHIYTHAVEPVLRAMHQQARGYTHAIQIDPILPHQLTLSITGNPQLLETALPCDEVLPARGGPRCPATPQLYLRLLGGPQLNALFLLHRLFHFFFFLKLSIEIPIRLGSSCRDADRGCYVYTRVVRISNVFLYSVGIYL